MRLGLTNTIAARGTPVGGDGLALDLQFAADKTLTARRGPTPILTRGSTGTFVGSNGLIQTAAVNAARFDHDPVTLASRGLLIEEGRTNVWFRSEELSTTPWSPIATTTFAVNDQTAPDGQLTAERIIVGATTQTYGTGNNQLTFATGTTYTASCFFKANQITRVAIQSGNTAILPAVAIFDLTGSGSVVGTPTGTASIQQFANGWYRCSVTGTAAANGITSIRFCAISGTSFSYPGNGVDSFYAWGAQMELASFATSYIPTTTSALARSADVCSISGAAFSGFYNATEGTSFVSAIRYTNFANPRSLAITNGTSGNRAEQARGTSVEEIGYYAGGSFLHGLSLSAATVGVNYRIAHAMAANNFAASMNGASPVVNNSGVMLTADRMVIGANFQGSAGFHNGTISAIRYYRKRLPNAKLQALTA